MSYQPTVPLICKNIERLDDLFDGLLDGDYPVAVVGRATMIVSVQNRSLLQDMTLRLAGQRGVAPANTGYRQMRQDRLSGNGSAPDSSG
jgi:hypothetical protein